MQIITTYFSYSFNETIFLSIASSIMKHCVESTIARLLFLRLKKLTFCGESMFFTFHFFTQNSLFLVVFVVKMRI